MSNNELFIEHFTFSNHLAICHRNCNDRLIFLIGIMRGGVELGPLGTAATNRPIVPAPGDYDDGEICGMMIGRGNRSTRRKPVPLPLCLPQTPHALPGRETGSPRWEASV
jgi:hypothetical protein